MKIWYNKIHDSRRSMVDLAEAEIRIGRDPTNSLVLPSPGQDPCHVRQGSRLRVRVRVQEESGQGPVGCFPRPGGNGICEFLSLHGEFGGLLAPSSPD